MCFFSLGVSWYRASRWVLNVSELSPGRFRYSQNLFSFPAAKPQRTLAVTVLLVTSNEFSAGIVGTTIKVSQFEHIAFKYTAIPFFRGSSECRRTTVYPQTGQAQAAKKIGNFVEFAGACWEWCVAIHWPLNTSISQMINQFTFTTWFASIFLVKCFELFTTSSCNMFRTSSGKSRTRSDWAGDRRWYRRNCKFTVRSVVFM